MMRLIPDHVWAAMTIWQEARGESFAGKVAVAEVIRNRTKTKYMSNGTIAGTVLRERQFSGWNHNDPNRIPAALLDTDDQAAQDCLRAWTEAEAGSDTVNGSRHYFNPSICDPPWAKGAEVLAEIGNHRFVKPKGGK